MRLWLFYFGVRVGYFYFEWCSCHSAVNRVSAVNAFDLLLGAPVATQSPLTNRWKFSVLHRKLTYQFRLCGIYVARNNLLLAGVSRLCSVTINFIRSIWFRCFGLYFLRLSLRDAHSKVVSFCRAHSSRKLPHSQPCFGCILISLRARWQTFGRMGNSFTNFLFFCLKWITGFACLNESFPLNGFFPECV